MATKKTSKTTARTPSAKKKSSSSSSSTATAGKKGPFTLAIDVGGSGLKASVLDRAGAMTTERVRIDTPQPCTPELLVDGLTHLGEQLAGLGQRWERISVGFPGLVRHGVIRTAPNLNDDDVFAGFDIAAALSKALGAPGRAVNDADMQGLAVISGDGVEMVCTLGTGFGTALFADGRLQSHLEIAHLPFRKGETFDVQLGDDARRKIGKRKWQRRVLEALGHMATLTGFDHLYLGGGNAKHLGDLELPAHVTIVDNSAGIRGGVRLWDDSVGDV
ncbi:MAG TPA: ROK family protein [Myxococcota bacterium]